MMVDRRCVLPAIVLACVGACAPGARHGYEGSPITAPASSAAAGPTTVRVAGIVLKWITADREANYDRAESLIREAAAKGAQLVITTECFLDGYAIRDKTIPLEKWRALGEPIPGGAYLKRLAHLADALNIYLIAGMLERAGDRTYNAAVLLGPNGRLLGHYRKQSMGHELVRNTPGDASPVFDTPLGRIGIMICADRREPTLVHRLADNGAEMLVCPSGGMWGPEKNDHHLQARSRETGLPVVFVHPIEFLVTGPDGAILDRRFAGEDMSLPLSKANSPRDSRMVALFDVPVQRRSHTAQADR